MARVSFRQGIVRHGKSPGQTFFLQQNGQFVDLVVSPDQTIIAFADGDKDYLFTESVTVIKAWGPFAVSQDYWLYWDINRVTGIRTYGSTTLAPVYAPTAPISPTAGQMWFDTSTGDITSPKMYEYNGAAWVQVLRVVASKYGNASQFFSPVDNVSLESNFTGTQAGSIGNTPKNIGSLVFDSSNKPIVNQNGKFFTTEDVFTTGVPTGASLKVNNILLRAQSTENIAPYQVVVFNNYNKIKLAAPFDFINKVYGIVEEAVPINDIANVITQGVIFNESWDFVNSTATPPMVGNINDSIYVTSAGELTSDISFSIPGQVPVGVIIGLQTILFSPGIYGTGLGNNTVIDHGALSGLLDDDHPQYLNDTRGDSRYYKQTSADLIFAPIVHTHTKSDITDFAHTHTESDIIDLDKYTQSEVDNFLNGKVSIAGDTMTGLLLLSADPSVPLGAATKQYVDAVAAGIDAKDSVGVATTADIGGTYNAIGGTGGSGEFTGVDVRNLDGALNNDYHFNTTLRVLVKDQTDPTQNGIYVITDISTPASSTLERASDQDGTPASEVSPGNYTFVAEGLTYAGTGWIVLAGTASGSNDTIILNTDDINWSQVSSATSFTAGLNVDISPSNAISVVQASSGGTVDALTWNGETINLTIPVNDQILLYDSAIPDWKNGYLSFIRNSSNSSNVTIDTITNNINITSAGTGGTALTLNSAGDIVTTSAGNTNINGTLAVNISSTGNTSILAGTSTSVDLNQSTDVISLTSSNVVVGPSTGAQSGIIKLNSNGYKTSLEAASGLTADTIFRLPANNGTSGQLLSTSGTGVTSWINAPSGGGGSAYCLKDADGDTFVQVGFGGSPLCTDSGSNIIQIQAGDAQLSGDGAGDINIISGRAYPGNGYSAGNISITVPDALNTGTNTGGNITLQSGAGYGANSGGINLYGANATSTGSTGGDIVIKAGDGPLADNVSGNIFLTAGSFLPSFGGSTSNNTGDIHIQTVNPGGGLGKRTTGHIYLEPGTNDLSADGQADDFRGSIKIQSNGYNAYENPDLRFYTPDKVSYTSLVGPLTMPGNSLNITMPNAIGTEGQILALTIRTGLPAGVDYGQLDFYDQPYDIVAQGFGVLSDGDVIMRFVAPRDMKILSSTLNSSLPHTGYAATAPSGADALFDISTITVNDTVTSIGTITFANGVQRPTASAFPTTIVYAGQTVVVTCTTASSIADVGITVGGRITLQ